MRWTYIGGVLLLYGGWMMIGAISEHFPLRGLWNDALMILWLAMLLLIQTIPWARFARRIPGRHPLSSTALHALIASALAGGVASALSPALDAPFPAPPCEWQGR